MSQELLWLHIMNLSTCVCKYFCIYNKLLNCFMYSQRYLCRIFVFNDDTIKQCTVPDIKKKTHKKLFTCYVYECVFLGLERGVLQNSEHTSMHRGINLYTKTECKYCWGRNGWLPVISDQPPSYLPWCRFGMFVCLSAYLSVWLGVCLLLCLSVCLSICLSSSIQADLAHCLPSATWLAWKRLGWNWFEVASKHMKDWCFASTAATWIVPSHLSNVPLVPFYSKPPDFNQWKTNLKEKCYIYITIKVWKEKGDLQKTSGGTK